MTSDTAAPDAPTAASPFAEDVSSTARPTMVAPRHRGRPRFAPRTRAGAAPLDGAARATVAREMFLPGRDPRVARDPDACPPVAARHCVADDADVDAHIFPYGPADGFDAARGLLRETPLLEKWREGGWTYPRAAFVATWNNPWRIRFGILS